MQKSKESMRKIWALPSF